MTRCGVGSLLRPCRGGQMNTAFRRLRDGGQRRRATGGYSPPPRWGGGGHRIFSMNRPKRDGILLARVFHTCIIRQSEFMSVRPGSEGPYKSIATIRHAKLGRRKRNSLQYKALWILVPRNVPSRCQTLRMVAFPAAGIATRPESRNDGRKRAKTMARNDNTSQEK